MRKKVINFAIIIIGIGLIISLSRSIWRLLKVEDRITQAETKVEELEKENIKLTELKDYYKSEEFIEEQARNKLNLSKEGEIVVILPSNVEELVGFEEPKKIERMPNWERWYKLFF